MTTFLELPDDAFRHVHLTFSERQALDRALRNEPLGQSARKTFNRARAKLDLEWQRSARAAEEREREYQPSGGPSATAGAARSRAPAPPRPPASPASSPRVGGGGAFNAMDASPEQIDRNLALLGVSMPPGSLDMHCNRRRGSTTNEVALQLAEAQAGRRDVKLREERERRSREIDAARASGTAFDAMSPGVSVDEVRARLGELGVRDPLVLDTFRPAGKPLEPPKPPPVSKAEQQRERRDRALLADAAAGRRIDVTRFSEDGFQRFLRLRFGEGASASSWPATRASRR